MTKIVESKVWNSALVCFQQYSVNSGKRTHMRGVDLNDRLVRRATGKDKIALHFLKASTQDPTTPLGKRDLASSCPCLSERVDEIALVEMNVLPAIAATFARSQSGFKHARPHVTYQ